MPEITLRAMRFHTLVGILPHEREITQPIEIDLTVRVSDGAHDGAHDGVIDYRVLYQIAADVVRDGPIDFLEDIGERIATRALAHSARVRQARVAVRKPHVPLGGPLDHVEVVVERAADA
jgi:dihydroneopterin aldolase